jgi:hypothetical protein
VDLVADLDLGASRCRHDVEERFADRRVGRKRRSEDRGIDRFRYWLAGVKIKIGDQIHEAPASFIVHPGSFDITAELDGYLPETHAVTIAVGEHQKLEINFVKKAHSSGNHHHHGK